MSSLADRLRQALAHADISQAELARRCGVKQPSVHGWFSGKSRFLRGENLLKAASALGVSQEWLATGRGKMRARDSVGAMLIAPEIRDGYVRFPLLEGYAGMGQGDYMPDFPEVVEFVEVAREWAEWKLRGIPLAGVRVITGRGDSMRGEFEHGDLIFVDARVKQFLADSAYVFRWHGRVQVKRLQQIGNGKVRILSRNAAYPPVDVPLDEIEIGGRALAAWTLREF